MSLPPTTTVRRCSKLRRMTAQVQDRVEYVPAWKYERVVD
jgi:hypothetical protein